MMIYDDDDDGNDDSNDEDFTNCAIESSGTTSSNTIFS